MSVDDVCVCVYATQRVLREEPGAGGDVGAGEGGVGVGGGGRRLGGQRQLGGGEGVLGGGRPGRGGLSHVALTAPGRRR